MSGPEQTPPPAPETLSFEDALGELEEIIDRIEQGRIGLEESLAAHRRGSALIRRCRAILDGAEQELETIAPSEPAADERGT